MNRETLKKSAAQAALSYVKANMLIGVGTGSTTNYFIDALAPIKNRIEGAVASSVATEKRLKNLGIHVVDLNHVTELDVYVDSADEFNNHFYLIKGGGGAHTREKIVASAARKFICIIDESKEVDVLGHFPVPVEVIPMARSFVAREITKLGADPVYRQGFITDNGNVILDIHHLEILNPPELESTLNNIPGVVANGIFAKRKADILLVSTETGVRTKFFTQT